VNLDNILKSILVCYHINVEDNSAFPCHCISLQLKRQLNGSMRLSHKSLSYQINQCNAVECVFTQRGFSSMTKSINVMQQSIWCSRKVRKSIIIPIYSISLNIIWYKANIIIGYCHRFAAGHHTVYSIHHRETHLNVTPLLGQIKLYIVKWFLHFALLLNWDSYKDWSMAIIC
jgi:hypothetical protein